MISVKKTVTFIVSTALAVTLYSGLSMAEEKTGLAKLGDVAGQVAAVAESGSLGDLLNINTATSEMLAQIPGIGEQIGQAIVQYRESNGSFKQITDLLNIEGIDASLLETIKPFLQL